MTGTLFEATTWILPVLLAVTLHEAAHGWAASRLGDDTALRLGRVSINPLRHIDPFGTVLLPAMLLLASGGQMMFGFAKPVPVDFRRLRPLRLGMVLVALAGPVTNIILMVAGVALLSQLGRPTGSVTFWIQRNLELLALFNAVLALFNMIPLPPLDGGRVLVGILPPRLAAPVARLERAGIFIVLGVIAVLPWAAQQVGIDFDPFYWLIGEPAQVMVRGAFALFSGH